MKAITCELCGSNDIQKQDGLFVCQHCGTKYTVEEAQKLLATVRIDNTERLKSLITLARRARSNGNSNDAAKYYDLIRQELPNDWESNFYAVFYRAANCRIAEIESAAKSVKNSIHTTFSLIKHSSLSSIEKLGAVRSVCHDVFAIADLFNDAAEENYNSISSSIQSEFYGDYLSRQGEAYRIKRELCDELCSEFGDNESIFTSVGFEYVKKFIKERSDYPYEYISTIHRYEPSYEDPDRARKDQEYENLMRECDELLKASEKPQGCYIATAIYGSYDCPEVWTLRRYRDNILAVSCYGKVFIKLYYAISPLLVKWFGDTNWFKSIWKPFLDRVVKRLNLQGVPDTPYND